METAETAMKTVMHLGAGLLIAMSLSVAGYSSGALGQEGDDEENDKASLSVVAPAALKKCVRCHNMSLDDKRKTKGGPVFGIMGEKPLKKSIAVQKWDDESLDKYLENPSALDPKPKMKYKVKDSKKRAEIIKYLKDLK
jgi:cytochrome c2